MDYGLTQFLSQMDGLSVGENMGRVVATGRDIFKLGTANGEYFARLSGSMFRQKDVEHTVFVGDFVLFRGDDTSDVFVIDAVLPRRTLFKRMEAGTGGRVQGIASNIDTVFVCTSANKDFNVRRLERYVTAVYDSGAMPVIVLTKQDVCDCLAEIMAEVSENCIGVPVMAVSALTGDGLDDLACYMKRGQTVCFVGSSGVGKSTLMNYFLRNEIMATQDIRSGDDKGRHTTTTRELFVTDGGVMIIDTPGMREFRLTSGTVVSQTFSDIEALALSCKFRDCSHVREKGCAVLTAIETGAISKGRWQSYQKLKKEMLYEERKSDMTASQVQKEKVKDMMGSLKAYKNIQKYNRKK